jgi:hypothetical protein
MPKKPRKVVKRRNNSGEPDYITHFLKYGRMPEDEPNTIDSFMFKFKALGLVEIFGTTYAGYSRPIQRRLFRKRFNRTTKTGLRYW